VCHRQGTRETQHSDGTPKIRNQDVLRVCALPRPARDTWSTKNTRRQPWIEVSYKKHARVVLLRPNVPGILPHGRKQVKVHALIVKTLRLRYGFSVKTQGLLPRILVEHHRLAHSQHPTDSSNNLHRDEQVGTRDVRVKCKLRCTPMPRPPISLSKIAIWDCESCHRPRQQLSLPS